MAMFLMLAVSLGVVGYNEQKGTPQLANEQTVDLSTDNQPGGNMEGKESRFGIATSATWAAFTTAASNGSVNSMHDSYTPIGGMVPMLLMQLGEVVFGGTGCGLYGMLGFAILTVFIAGLMVGRTPEFLGKKIEPFEMKMAVLVCLATPVAILVGSGIAALLPQVGLDMLFVRLPPIFAVLAIAGSLAQKKNVAQTAGTLSTTNAMFVFLLILVVLIVGALSFFPALSLGPIAEFFQM